MTDHLHRMARLFKALVRLARPQEYVKNAFVFLPVLFGHRLTDSGALYLSSLAFVAFCFLASAVYTFNDIRDKGGR
jgi:decaprenyl-phosphate phosphoribosyltransferase